MSAWRSWQCARRSRDWLGGSCWRGRGLWCWGREANRAAGQRHGGPAAWRGWRRRLRRQPRRAPSHLCQGCRLCCRLCCGPRGRARPRRHTWRCGCLCRHCRWRGRSWRVDGGGGRVSYALQRREDEPGHGRKGRYGDGREEREGEAWKGQRRAAHCGAGRVAEAGDPNVLKGQLVA